MTLKHDCYTEDSPGNVWVNRWDLPNSGKILMIQFSSRLMSQPEPLSDQYYSEIYNTVEGYHRTSDFWEIPQWQARIAASLRADTYVIRDLNEAVEFIKRSGYESVAISVMEANLGLTRDLISMLPHTTFRLGGYVNLEFLGSQKVRIYKSIEEMVGDLGARFVDGYDYGNFSGTRIIPRLRMSTGCLNNCLFCTVPQDNPFASLNPNQIKGHMESFSPLRYRLVYLDDKTFGQSPTHVYLKECGISLKKMNPGFDGFIIQTTPTTLLKTQSPRSLSDAGVRYVELGIESYNDSILNEMGKPSRTREIDWAVDLLGASGVKLIPNIIIGLPGETRLTYEKTLRFLNRNREIISHINVYNLAVYETTRMRHYFKNKGDRDENTPYKSFHGEEWPLHAEYYNHFLRFGLSLLEQTVVGV